MDSENRDTNFNNDNDSSEPSVEQDRDVELETQCLVLDVPHKGFG